MKYFARILAATAALAAHETFANTTIHLLWDPSPSPTVAGYNLCWGTNQAAYSFTNVCQDPNQTNCDITGLSAGVYYLSVQAFDTNNLVSDFANVVVYTNTIPISTNTPPMPPTPTNGSGTSLTNSGSTTNNGYSTNASSSSTNSVLATNQQTYVLGIPPSLVITHSNAQTHVVIWGTLDADISIERSTNLGAAAWQTVTNVTLTNLVQLPLTNLYSQSATGVLTNAFVPGYSEVVFDDPDQSAFAFHRIEMPYDYPILAGKTLVAKGYAPRLLTVRMPGVTTHDACYVGSEGGFIDCLDDSWLVRFQGASGSTIRMIAGSVANSLSQNWTSASEFSYSNGVRLLTATVVQSDPPSSDPVAGSPSSTINIDF